MLEKSLQVARRGSQAFVETLVPDGESKNGVGVLPDWRMTTDCSAYGRDCVLHKLAQRTYVDYPFQLGVSHDHLYTWRTDMPDGWQQALADSTPKAGDIRVDKQPRVDASSLKKCVRAAQSSSVRNQLSTLLGQLTRADGMLSFTISDFSYARDMIDDVYEMAHNIMGFRDAFFMVAFDAQTIELACAKGYPFLAWPKEEGSQLAALKMGVASAKFEISHALAAGGVPSFFFEMDLWFVRSPLLALRKHLVDADVVFSGHQNNPDSANIGAYGFRANNATEEYLRVCLDILRQSPATHDQLIMQQVYRFIDQIRLGHAPVYNPHFAHPVPPVPIFSHPVTHTRFSSHEIVADEHLLPTEDTFAIHPLCGSPLANPHGKKMVAKELGGWVGSRGYYSGGASGGRYLWLDGHPWNGYSFVHHFPGHDTHYTYHNLRNFKWVIAVSVALARRTGRVWVMPKVLGDRGVQFLWILLDLQSLEGLVEYRETNFPSNPKAWRSPLAPFSPVSRSALTDGGRMYVQLTAENISGEVLSWRAKEVAGEGGSPFDVWFAAHSTIVELRDAQVLLAGMPTGAELLRELATKVRMGQSLSLAEKEIRHVMLRLKWCPIEISRINFERTAGHETAQWDCYAKGQNTTLQDI